MKVSRSIFAIILVTVLVIVAVTVTVVVTVVLPSKIESANETPLPSPSPKTTNAVRIENDDSGTEGISLSTVGRLVSTKVPSCNANARKWIRMVFHDAITGSMDASLRLELDEPGNSKGGFESELIFYKQFVSKSYSLADIMCIGGVVALKMCAGLDIPVSVGRIDALFPNVGPLPSASIGAQESLDLFGIYNLTADEAVAVITGSHSVAFAPDPANVVIGSTVSGSLDSTPFLMDNRIFIEIQNSTIPEGGARLQSDLNMWNSPTTSPYVLNFARNLTEFYMAFQSGFIKLMNANVNGTLSTPALATSEVQPRQPGGIRI